MYVEFGNANALEGFRDPASDNPDEVHYRSIEGNRVTRVTFPEEVTLQEAFSTSITALGFHMEAEAKPTWIESDSAGLQALLEEHYGIAPSKNTRPKTWGRETGVLAASDRPGEDA